jgi:streptomycin 6-kinase
VQIPSTLERWWGEPEGAAWLQALPGIVAHYVDAWGLRLGSPFEAYHSFVAPAVTADGGDAVLKVNLPNADMEREPDALLAWGGVVSVRLLASDPERRALLVERCRPGSQLWSVEDDAEATTIAANVMRRLWCPPPAGHRFRRLADEAARWAIELPQHYERHGRPFERSILDEAVFALTALGPDQREQVVVHQDLHGGNIISAQREPWLVIDPQPLVAEPEFDVASLLRDRREVLVTADGSRTVARRLDILSDLLGLDRERMRLWGVAHALAWGIDGEEVMPDHVHAARLLHEA